ncbi:Hypothetical protein ZOBELLIA_838 [Zobellia galactanivorans]|uniref:Uncharacterized protein n=1 Tax=Zobellia galactanivorans (strain DSM 12802 / CCUG 47099 / CIP 106680 / NCIMB 13871 / Dsij) TaxID=63186 RepID=G0L236_ZOBGA|nr:Hypothetical protein ZOBELLIA_838 [Zobellia galactanivorans]
MNRRLLLNASRQKPEGFFGFEPYVALLCKSFIKITRLLSRKVEGIDPVKPWQPFSYKEGATFYPSICGTDNKERQDCLSLFLCLIVVCRLV